MHRKTDGKSETSDWACHKSTGNEKLSAKCRCICKRRAGLANWSWRKNRSNLYSGADFNLYGLWLVWKIISYALGEKAEFQSEETHPCMGALLFSNQDGIIEKIEMDKLKSLVQKALRFSLIIRSVIKLRQWRMEQIGLGRSLWGQEAKGIRRSVKPCKRSSLAVERKFGRTMEKLKIISYCI